MMKRVDLAMREFQAAESMDNMAPLPNVENIDSKAINRRIMPIQNNFLVYLKQ